MSGNSSPNDSLPHLQLSSTGSSYCLLSPPTSIIFISSMISYALLLLPLCIYILHRGLQQWSRSLSTSSAAAMSYSDCFTYHVVVMEMVGVVRCILNCYAVFSGDRHLLDVGDFLLVYTWYGEMFFHVLTCVERYLAVVHPVTYLSLRGERGLRIRTVPIAGVWLLCFLVTGLAGTGPWWFILNFGLLALFLLVISFCSLSVLRLLIRPGPGEGARNQERVDQLKQKAFHTIVAILGVLVLRFLSNLVWSLLFLYGQGECVLKVCESWFNMPSSLVLPLLFLHREAKLL